MHLPILLAFALNMLVVQSHWKPASHPTYRSLVQDRKPPLIRFVPIVLPSPDCVCLRNDECHQDYTSLQWGCNVTNYVCCHIPTQQEMDPTIPQHSSLTENQTQRPTPHNPSEMIHQMPVGSSAIQNLTRTSTTGSNQTHSSSNSDCTCTPFFRCYDEETSSNLTNIVNDRINIPLCQDSKAHKICLKPDDVCCCNMEKPSEQPEKLRPSTTTPSKCEGNCKPASDCPGEDIPSTISKQGICLDSDHICCHELNLHESSIPPITPSLNSTLSPSSQSQIDCIGSCVPINECSDLANTWELARKEDKDALIKLRKAVCSNTDGRLSVCCP